jgi:rod shape-determining protein MreC
MQFSKTHEGAFAGVANEVTGWTDSKYNDIDLFFHLKAKNKALLEENARLHNMLLSNFNGPDSNAIAHIDTLMKDTLGRVREFIWLPAKVVNSYYSEENNYIMLQRGAAQGVEKDMAVVSPEGIVGKVVMVSENYSKAMSLLHHNNKVSCMLKKGNYNGMLEWDGKSPDELLLSNISRSADVKKGDTVLTSTLSGNFPPGIMVGKIVNISGDAASNFYTLRVKPATNFYTLQYAYLIGNSYWKEQKKLQDSTLKR